MILGTIDSIDSANGLRVIVDGESNASTKKYNYLSSYVPETGDHVLIEEINGSYVILGKVISEVTNSGIVRYATNAGSAQNAVNAQNATNATNAANAQNAANAENAVNAQLAALAEQATKATEAASCTGNAATATKAVDISRDCRNYETGYLVRSVSREYDSSLSKYIVTDVQLTSIRDFVYKAIV